MKPPADVDTEVEKQETPEADVFICVANDEEDKEEEVVSVGQVASTCMVDEENKTEEYTDKALSVCLMDEEDAKKEEVVCLEEAAAPSGSVTGDTHSPPAPMLSGPRLVK